MVPQTLLYSTGEPTGLLYDEVYKFTCKKRNVIIDVRDRYEVQETGRIPGSINVPLSEVEFALEHLNDEQFKKQYGANKPGKHVAIIFYCMATSRSREAAKRARAVGYTNVNFYVGGYNDWVKRNN